jgi:hypothetical protein
MSTPSFFKNRYNKFTSNKFQLEFYMKKLLAFILLASSLTSFAKVSLNTNGDRKEFEQYTVSSDKAGKVTVNVDRELVKVDCHGLGTKYYQDNLASGEVLVSKEFLVQPKNMCKPGIGSTATSGISFVVEFKEATGGIKQLLVPVGAKVTTSNR